MVHVRACACGESRRIGGEPYSPPDKFGLRRRGRARESDRKPEITAGFGPCHCSVSKAVVLSESVGESVSSPARSPIHFC
jgi:hypothetical protein